ncbi:IPT/TIG domain-containing protein [Nocardioides sp. MH1]|uniref:IPT/TIG domain-containing protein n=1 Tax=Nocardioides sp. MH1 TaxID=3242490 RepID=UPI003520D202
MAGALMLAVVLTSIRWGAFDAAAAPDDSSVSTIGELQAAGDTCTGTRTAPTAITVAEDITAPADQVEVACHAVLDLAGHDLTVRNVVIDRTRALTVVDTGTGGALIADAGETSDLAGIQNTAATFTVNSGIVTATGGLHGAGIGGGSTADGGTTVINGGTVTAATVNSADSSGSSAVGPGDGGSSFGSLLVGGGVLRLPSGFVRVPDSRAGPEISIVRTGEIDGSTGPGATYAAITGAGQIDNRGRMLLPTANATGGGVAVTGRHYALTFDTQGGSTPPAPVTVFADTVTHGARSFPPNPTEPGATFAGWNSAADGTGTRVTATSVLPGSSGDGTPVGITAYAQWKRVPAVKAIAPSSGPTAGGTTVVITGTGFTGATKVTFGSAGPATSFTVDSPTQVTAVSPPAATTGRRLVTVTTPSGTSPYLDAARFTYTTSRPAVTSITPAAGPTTGGTTVVITGTGFTGATKVTFGSAGPATSFTVDSPTRVTAVSPPAPTTGRRLVTVTTVGGTSPYLDAARFSYTAARPAVTGITPAAGPTAGGTTVVITGTGFTGATKVTFGDVGPATSFTVDSATQVTAVSPPAATTGRRLVTVTTVGGTSPYLDAARFSYAATPTVTGIAPAAGPTAGGTTVVITGTGFTGATKVTFGDAGPAASFTVDSATRITAVAPAAADAGARHVTVTTAGGTSDQVDADRFTYTAPRPALTGIAPASGPTTGGTTVVITGTDLTGATDVTFGAAGPATSFTVDSATRITAVAPAAADAGVRHVTVTTASGTSDQVDADRFTYTAPPAVTGIAPASGPTTGGTTVVITGTDLTDATDVTFGAAGPATSFTVDSPTQITATAPAAADAGARHVTVTTASGTSDQVDADRFTYTAVKPAVTAIAPAAGPLVGGTTVVITGTDLTDATDVTFGSAGPASAFTVDSPAQITATSPAVAEAGARHVTVTTPGGTSDQVDADRFTYTAVKPAVTAIAPAAGPLVGGTTVVITGTGFTGATNVVFGSAGPASAFTVDSATQITATSPAASATGPRLVTVTTAGGVSGYLDAARFTYTAVPTVTRVAPTAAPTAGGTTVVITGTGFTGATDVTFGSAGPATSFTVDSAFRITATSPAVAEAGARHVTVTTAGGTSAEVDADLFTYAAPPAVTGIAPSSGPIAGGTTVVITGTDLAGATKVTFGSAGPATSFTVDSATQITAVSPPVTTTGPRTVTVFTAGGVSAFLEAARFTYTAPRPAVTAIAPAAGPAAGGTTVVITGTDLTGATAVTFGAAGPATSFTVDSATQITAVAPPSTTTGPRAITVTTVGGLSAYLDDARFVYTAQPAVTGIAPAAGPTAGGTTVVITGTDLTGATKVTFGDAGPATSLTVDSATRITAVAPAAADAGVRHVSVTTAGGASAEVDADRFAYTAAPTVTAIAPSAGPTTGGTTVVITGTDLTGATAVTFGAAGPATSFTVDSPTQVTATAPAAADTGVRHITVTTAGGPSAEGDTDLFTYTAAITRIAPSAGPIGGGTNVVITGTGFTGATDVTFGDAGPATSFTVDSPNRITATSPAATDTGPRTVRVTTADGSPAAAAAGVDRFTYTDPPDACGDLLVKDDGSTWTCSFVDNFDGQSLDPTKWILQQTALSGVRTDETCYVDSPDNIAVRDGELLLTTRRESQDIACDSPTGAFSTPYSGGMVGTRGKFSQTYGRFEIRAKYPDVTVAGLHGGFWAMPANNTYGLWPASGELDIAEWWSNASTYALPTLHYVGDSADDTGWGCQVSTPSSFHTYTMEWYPHVVRFFIDGAMCFERSWNPLGLLSPQPFDQPFSMILNMGVGTLSGINQVSSDTPLPATYTIDYAKVWR